jgi:glycerophosphoryl diester phosphodiesterase
MSEARPSHPRGWPYARVVAHRGGGVLAPENTLAGMQAAVDHGHVAVEFDVMLTRDGVPVLMHDDMLGRTVAGSGCVADLLSDDLVKRDAGSWMAPRFSSSTVPRYVDAVAWLRQHGVWMNVEIKPSPGADVATGEAVGRLTQALFEGVDDVAATPLLSSFSFVALEAARRVAPDIPRALLVSVVPSDWQAQLVGLDAIALHCNHRHLTSDIASQVKAAGYGLFCYTVNDPDRARELLAWGVDAFCTDRIDLIGPGFGL